MNFENLQRAKALLSDRWIYGQVERYEPGTHMIGDVNVKSATISSLKGFDANVSWDSLTNNQKNEFVNMVNSVIEDGYVTIATADQYWKGMPIFE